MVGCNAGREVSSNNRDYSDIGIQPYEAVVHRSSSAVVRSSSCTIIASSGNTRLVFRRENLVRQVVQRVECFGRTFFGAKPEPYRIAGTLANVTKSCSGLSVPRHLCTGPTGRTGTSPSAPQVIRWAGRSDRARQRSVRSWKRKIRQTSSEIQATEPCYSDTPSYHDRDVYVLNWRS